jgi:hypothetical protein
MVPKLARGNDAEGACGRYGAALGTSQRVLPAAGIVDDLALLATREVELAHDDVARVASARALVAIA